MDSHNGTHLKPTVDTGCMSRILGSDELAVAGEELVLCLWAMWCGGGWEGLAKILLDKGGITCAKGGVEGGGVGRAQLANLVRLSAIGHDTRMLVADW